MSMKSTKCQLQINVLFHSGDWMNAVLAIETIKLDLNSNDWTGDPCLPSPYEWLTCSIVDKTSHPSILKMYINFLSSICKIFSKYLPFHFHE